MPDPFRKEPKGFFASGMDWLDELAQVPKNVLRGDFGAVGRHTANILGDAVDAFLPGDWIPDFTRPEDYVSSSDLIGLDEKEHPVLAFGANLVGDTLLNPATYFGGAALKGVGKLAKMGTEAARGTQLGEKVLNAGDKIGQRVRSTFGAQDIPEDLANAAAKAKNTEGLVREAQVRGTADLFSGTTDADNKAIGEIMHGIQPIHGPARFSAIDETDQLTLPERAAKYLETAPPEVNRERVLKAISDLTGFNERQWLEGQSAGNIGGNVFTKGIRKPEESLLEDLGDQGRISQGERNYFPRQFKGVKAGETEEDALGRPSSIRGRSLTTPGQAADFLAENPDVSLEMNPVKAMGTRAEQSGVLAGRAEMGKFLTKNPEFRLANDVDRSTAQAAIKALPPESQQVAGDIFNGMAPRGAVTSLLARTNRVFKPAAVTGFVIPKLGSDVRNALSSVWQTYSNPEARQHTWEMAKQFVPNILKTVDDGLEHMFGVRVHPNEFAEYEQALKASGGQASKAVSLIQDPMLQAAVRQGVLGNNFVTTEHLVSETARKGAKKWLGKLADLPAVLFKGTEQRARYTAFKALHGVEKLPEAQAGRITRETFYDYNVSSQDNRTARDVIPFFQFSAKAIPQQAKLLTEKPWLATGLASAMTNVGGSDPVYPYMEGKLNVPIGSDEQGNDQYVSGFGLPFETLVSIPNPSGSPQDFGRDIERSIVGSSNPLLKTAFAAVAGEDPFFQTPYGSYDKAPIVGHAGDAGRMYNELSGTGLIEPLDQPLRSIDKLLDDRRSGGVKALDLLTGANVVNVDPAIALRQQLEQALASDPSIQQHRSFFDSTKDPKAQALLAQYKEAQKKVKAKRKHAPSSLGTP